MKEFNLKGASELAQTTNEVDFTHRIGTYNERSQHRTLKFILEEDPSFHEVPIGPYIADICRDKNIYEIQTAGFKSLVAKLTYFTPEYDVTVVYPAAVVKTVIWIDPESGEYTAGRRFTKKSARYKLFSELIHIHEFIKDSKIKLLLIETEASDYRLLDGRGKEKKIKATKSDIVPTKILNVTEIAEPKDLYSLLPFESEKEYTRADIEKILQLKGRNLSQAIKSLMLLGILEKISVDKKRVYYKKT